MDPAAKYSVHSFQINIGVGDGAIHLVCTRAGGDNGTKTVVRAVMLDGGEGAKMLEDNYTFNPNISSTIKYIEDNFQCQGPELDGGTNTDRPRLRFHAFVVTHWDSDHSDGIMYFLKKDVDDQYDTRKDGTPQIQPGDIRLKRAVYGQNNVPMSFFYAPSWKKFQDPETTVNDGDEGQGPDLASTARLSIRFGERKVNHVSAPLLLMHTSITTLLGRNLFRLDAYAAPGIGQPALGSLKSIEQLTFVVSAHDKAKTWHPRWELLHLINGWINYSRYATPPAPTRLFITNYPCYIWDKLNPLEVDGLGDCDMSLRHVEEVFKQIRTWHTDLKAARALSDPLGMLAALPEPTFTNDILKPDCDWDASEKRTRIIAEVRDNVIRHICPSFGRLTNENVNIEAVCYEVLGFTSMRERVLVKYSGEPQARLEFTLPPRVQAVLRHPHRFRSSTPAGRHRTTSEQPLHRFVSALATAHLRLHRDPAPVPGASIPFADDDEWQMWMRKSLPSDEAQMSFTPASWPLSGSPSDTTVADFTCRAPIGGGRVLILDTKAAPAVLGVSQAAINSMYSRARVMVFGARIEMVEGDSSAHRRRPGRASITTAKRSKCLVSRAPNNETWKLVDLAKFIELGDNPIIAALGSLNLVPVTSIPSPSDPTKMVPCRNALWFEAGAAHLSNLRLEFQLSEDSPLKTFQQWLGGAEGLHGFSVESVSVVARKEWRMYYGPASDTIKGQGEISFRLAPGARLLKIRLQHDKPDENLLVSLFDWITEAFNFSSADDFEGKKWIDMARERKFLSSVRPRLFEISIACNENGVPTSVDGVRLELQIQVDVGKTSEKADRPLVFFLTLGWARQMGAFLRGGFGVRRQSPKIPSCVLCRRVMSLLEHLKIESLFLSYVYESGDDAGGKEFEFNGVLLLGPLRLGLSFTHSDGEWDFEATLGVDDDDLGQQGTITLGDLLQALMGGTISELPKAVSEIPVSKPGGSSELLRLSCSKTEGPADAEGKPTEMIILVASVYISSVSLTFTQWRGTHWPSNCPSKRVIKVAVSDIGPLDAPLVGKIENLPLQEAGITKAEFDILAEMSENNKDRLFFKPDKADADKILDTDFVLLAASHFMVIAKNSKGEERAVLDYIFARPKPRSKPKPPAISGPDSEDDYYRRDPNEDVLAPAGDAQSSSEKEVSKAPWKATIGPLSIENIGLQFDLKTQRLGIVLDATFLMGPIGLALLGFGLSAKLGGESKAKPKPPNTVGQKGLGDSLALSELAVSLEGMIVSFDRPPVTVAGGFMHSNVDNVDCYAGGLIIGFKPYAIEAIGVYAKVPKNPQAA
ncbi:unnamed protein product [Parascedosporium putredinis]|uniref:DUF6603 domain-containing protein n=1 Tax=Parascedosporium putredinis TaxID=1442378 RepID=A0A9P1MAW6_9PEZI|nr:unnamed protein product [Parascedosporium putredinis]CAI7995130.1 unnamed protein product [Parascedosporium putredinis]